MYLMSQNVHCRATGWPTMETSVKEQECYMEKTIFDFVNDDAGRKAFLQAEREQRAQELRDLISPEAIAARAAAEKAQRDSAVAAQEATQEAKLRDKVRWAYVAANGSDAGFEVAYPALRARHVEAETLAHVGEAGDIVDRFIAKMNGGN